jgi:DNA primase catalytic core
MTTITNLNQISPEDLRKIIEDNQIIIKEKSSTYYKVICPNCNKPKAYIYFNQGTRTIYCNRKDKCTLNKGLWDYIAENRGYSNKDVTRYINQMLGYEFKDSNNQQGQSSETHHIIREARKEAELLEETITDKTTKTPEKIAEEQEFFKRCHQIFIDCLNDQDNEQVAFSLDYLKKERGYNNEQIRSFKLGFFPDKDKFISLLANTGYSQNEAEKLVTEHFTTILNNNKYQKEKESKNRITFTWSDTKNNIIGFSARKATTNEELKPKYLNNNRLSKTEHLFNFTEDIIGKDIVIVEGQLDALVGTNFASQQEEISNYHFVAMGGNSISESQITYLKNNNYSKVILLLDNDNAGKIGANQSAEKLLAQGVTPYIASIPDGYPCKDIDELIKKYPDSIDLKSLLTTDFIPTIKTQLKIKTIAMNSQNTTHPLIIELTNEIKQDQQELLENKESLDLHKYRKKIHGIKEIILTENITVNRKGNPDLIKLHDLLPNIQDYNDLIAIKGDEDTPYTYAKFFADIHKSPEGLKTGFKALDEYITIQPSSLAIIAGRPSHGKTTMMLNMLRNMIEKYPEKSFLFYSYEEKRQDILLKLILSMTKSSDLTKKDGVSPLSQLMEQLKSESSNESILLIKQKIEKWIKDGRLQIMTPKSNVEILSTSIIDRVIECKQKKQPELTGANNEKEPKPIAAIFIDYVQKLNSAEEKFNRQQEVQKVCQTLLHTALNKEVEASIILGAQVNREVKSLDSFNAENMREAGDIEQDANIILGVWDEVAGKVATLQEILTGSEKKLIEAQINEKKDDIDKLNKKLGSLKELIKKTQDDAESTQTKNIKILKNRNGVNNKIIELTSYPNRFLFKDKDTSSY